jgi:hypothetical protein
MNPCGRVFTPFSARVVKIKEHPNCASVLMLARSAAPVCLQLRCNFSRAERVLGIVKVTRFHVVTVKIIWTSALR